MTFFIRPETCIGHIAVPVAPKNASNLGADVILAARHQKGAYVA
jgi:hypothetical protein